MKSIDRQLDVKDSIRKHEELAEKLRAKKALGKDLKKAGKVAAGTALAAGLVYGGKKLYDKYKNKGMKEQKEFARTDYAGLSKTGKQLLKEYRTGLAKQLNEGRNQINSKLAEKIKRGSSALGDFKEFANQKRSLYQKQAQGLSDYRKSIYKEMGH